MLATSLRHDVSEHGTSKLPRAMIGDLAEPYTRFLKHQGYRSRYEYFLSPGTLQTMGLDDTQVEVRRLGIGGTDHNCSNCLIATSMCVTYGQARGVCKDSREL